MDKDNKKHFIVDCQLFQTDTWHRGMGKYSFELLRALSEGGIEKTRKVTLVFNNNLDKKHESIKKIQLLFTSQKTIFPRHYY